MESDETFMWYLHSRGIDTSEAQKLYLIAMRDKPEFIVSFYAKLFPEEYIAWETKKRILGDAST